MKQLRISLDEFNNLIDNNIYVYDENYENIMLNFSLSQKDLKLKLYNENYELINKLTVSNDAIDELINALNIIKALKYLVKPNGVIKNGNN